MFASLKQYLGFIIDQFGRSLYMDDSGHTPLLKRQSEPKPLRSLPDGWMSTDVKFSRNQKYWGIDRSYSNDYKFVRDGAFIIRNHSYKDRGSESKIWFVLLRWNPDTGIHETFFRTEIDMSKVSDDPKTGASVNLMEGGITKYLKSGESVPIEIPCNASNPDAREISIDGVQLSAVYNYAFPKVELVIFHNATTYTFPIAFLNFEGDSVGIIANDPQYEEAHEGLFDQSQVNNYYANLGSGNYLFRSANIVDINVKGQIKFLVKELFQPVNVISIKIFIQTYKVDGTNQTFVLFDESNMGVGDERVIDFDQDISLETDERVFLVSYTTAAVFTTQPVIELQDTSMKITFNSRNPISSTYSITAYDVWKYIVNKITDGRYSADSTLLQQKLNLRLTCGDALRGIETASIKTSYGEFADNIMKLLNAAVYIDYGTNTVYLENFEDIFDNTNELIDLGEVSDFTIEDDNSFKAKTINVGYEGKDATDNLGKQNFNDKKAFTTPLTRTAAVMDLVLKYRADIFTIEQIRTDYFAKDQTATEKDNDVFIIDCMEDGDELIAFRDNTATVTGGDNTASWYNLRLSPKNILLTNGSRISIGLWPLKNEVLQFQSGDRNKEMVVTSGGVTLVEKADVNINTLAAGAIIPKSFSFKTKVPYNLVPMLRQGRGYIKFTYNGFDLYGFAIDLSQKPVYDEPQEWKLLCSSLTDAESLIRINDVLTINGKGMISHKLPLKFVPVNPVFSPQHNFRHMDTEWFKNRISRYSVQRPFFQKWQTNDNTPLQFISEGADMNNILIYNCKGKIAGTITPSEISNPLITLPYKLWQATINWSLYEPFTEYYVYVSFGTGPGSKGFISEPISLRNQWEETLLIEYGNDRNQTDLIWKAPYSGKIRIEGMITKFEPQLELTSYEDSIRDVETLNGEPYRKWTLMIGTQCGTPDWLIDKLNRILPLSSLTIDGFEYAIDKDAKLDLKEIPGSPYAFWTITIRERYNRPGIEIDASGINNSDLTVQYNIETAAFTGEEHPNVNQTDNIIQITDVE